MIKVGLFGKKETKTGYYCMVEWTEEAVRNAVGADSLKVIYHLNNGYVFKKESYSQAKITRLLYNKVPIIDMTAGQEVPARAVIIPKTQQFLGQIQLHGRLP